MAEFDYPYTCSIIDQAQNDVIETFKDALGEYFHQELIEEKVRDWEDTFKECIEPCRESAESMRAAAENQLSEALARIQELEETVAELEKQLEDDDA